MAGDSRRRDQRKLIKRGSRGQTMYQTQARRRWVDHGGGTVAIEIKSKDSDWADLRRGVYQCVKYRAVLAAQDIRRDPRVECWLVTEIPLPGDLKSLARRLGVRTKAILNGASWGSPAAAVGNRAIGAPRAFECSGS